MNAPDAVLPGCAGGESFALRVLGHSMAPEFNEGEIIIIEPEGLASDGSYVIAWHEETWIFRQLVHDAAGWRLHALHSKPRRHAIAVNGPWRITFEWKNGDALRVDLEQYH